MSQAATPDYASQPALPAPGAPRRKRLGALETLERGFALFRSTFDREAWRYYLGSAPLVACFIPIWVFDGQVQVSGSAILLETAVLLCAYLLRVLLVGRYMQGVRGRAFGTPLTAPAGSGRTAALGRLLARKIMLSAAALATLPTLAGASWFYNASQFASLESRDEGVEGHSFTGNLALAGQWLGGGCGLLLSLIPLWSAIWMNGLILAMLVPQLLHSVFGVNTLLSTPLGIFSLLQSSAFWLSLSAGAWLALDPIVKCTYVIVYQSLRSRREGDDLRSLLASLPRERQKKAELISSNRHGGVRAGAMLAVALILPAVCLPARAQQSAPPAESATEVASESARQGRVHRLREALEQESRRATYRWHDAEHPSQPTWFDRLLARIGQAIENTWNRIVNFLRKLWPSGLNLPSGEGKRSGLSFQDIRVWLAIIVVLTLGAVAVLIWLRRRREETALLIPTAVAPIPDLNDAAVAAQRSEDEWFAMASRLEGEGDLRSAFRAAYFGLLAGLAQRQWLTIRRDRTNREYLDEFTRRWRRRPQAALEARAEVPDSLRGSLRQFDRVWYGLHAVTPEIVGLYRRNQQEFLNHV